ncbi:M24 family metallopeptidase [Novosphingobium sp. ST904]|uniref:M24 family metallopeptidase n=1 Tax=Novosphingobium sp. ST904 TaxID=1684385 RepID=UPI0006C8BF33|nr:M24 family metallopeptidase [Novosphingobium sp. ST904]KPH68471.1 (Fe-S)-binding protein [Novosphingobium sp. ST904]TCM25453.1 metallopeptidase family M24 [Novosphingobium sp. ST904]
MSATPASREAVGPRYDLDAIRRAQARSWLALERIAAIVRPGMRESEVHEAGRAVLAELGMEMSWHPLLIRFGANTLKIFSDRSQGDAVLAGDDIFFIDMGPVFDSHEGDVGATFTVGDDPEMKACAAASKQLFERVRTIWHAGAVTGSALYDRAAQEALAMGWELNLDIRGHRVSDYPHSVHKGGNLGDFEAVPGKGLWILEIQIRHPTRPFGAFYEDLLV